jgi:ABC-2 type transport system permease protein
MTAIAAPGTGPTEPRRSEHGTGKHGRRGALGLLAHQVRYEQLSFWRNPQSAFFTFVFPVVFIAIMGALFGGVGKTSYFFGLTAMQYYLPTIAALSVLGSCYGQLAVALAARRQNGMLKRVRATPLPAWAYFAGLLAHCVIVSVVDIALLVTVARLYGVPFPSHWLAIGLALVLGAASFCALGVAVASLISNAEAAPAVAQLVLFPLLFVSGTYLPIHSAALDRVAGWLPVRPFNEALTGPFARHTGPDWSHLAVLAAWGVLGAIVAIRRFRWNPRPE